MDIIKLYYHETYLKSAKSLILSHMDLIHCTVIILNCIKNSKRQYSLVLQV